MTPQAIVHLKTGEIRMIFVCESREQVKNMVNNATERLVTFTRWTASGTSLFSTRPDNVLTVEDNK